MYDYLVGRVLVLEVSATCGTTILSGTVKRVERENDGFATLTLEDATEDDRYSFVLKPEEPVVRNPDDGGTKVGVLTDFVVTAATPTNAS